MSNDKPPYDLDERTAVFGESVIAYAKRIPRNPINELIGQLVGAATSIGANYCEADDAGSRKEFMHRINLCQKEAKETKFFLRMIAKSEPQLRDDGRILWKEAHELHLIFCAIRRHRPPEDPPLPP